MGRAGEGGAGKGERKAVPTRKRLARHTLRITNVTTELPVIVHIYICEYKHTVKQKRRSNIFHLTAVTLGKEGEKRNGAKLKTCQRLPQNQATKPTMPKNK